MITPQDEPQGRVLVIDDEERNLVLLRRMLERAGYRDVHLAADPVEALESFVELHPDIVLLDLHMPKLDGYEVLGALSGLVAPDEFLPVIVITGDVSSASKARALSLGANDFVGKPFDVVEVSLRIRNLLATRFLHDRVRRHGEILEQKVKERTRELEQARVEILHRLGLAAEYRDDATHEHTRRVGANTCRLARALGLPAERAELLEQAAPLHDIGKIGISDKVLLSSGRLTEAEFDLVKRHPLIGARILSDSTAEVLKLGEEIAISHHERWDGSGYAQGLRGEEIPLSGRLVGVVDVFDALTHERPYKRAWTVAEAMKQMRADRGRHFDPEVLDAFVDLVADGEIEPG